MTMFPSPGNEPDLIKHDGKIIGVCLGADATTEHGCGIGPIRYAFGTRMVKKNQVSFMSDYEMWKRDLDRRNVFARVFRYQPPLPPMGMEKRKIHKVPDGLQRMMSDDGAEGFGYIGGRPFSDYHINEWGSRRAVNGLVAGWSDAAFYAMGTNGHTRGALADIYREFEEENIAIMIAPGALIATGLCILIADRIPKDIVESWDEADLTSFNNAKALDETGIKEYLKAKDKRYFALSRYHEFDDGEWRVWLNPAEQRGNNAGWFTIDELRQWGEDKGPVVRSRG
jgi:hypothetical protein